MPTPIADTPFLRLKDIKCQQKCAPQDPCLAKPQDYAASAEELSDFYSEMTCCLKKPIVLSVVAPHNREFVQYIDHLPRQLQSLYDPANTELKFPQILELAEQFKENITPAINGTPLGRHHSSSIVLQEMVQISCWSSHSIKVSCSGTYKPTSTINFTFEVHLLSRDEQLQKCLNWMSEWGCSHEKEALETYKSTMQWDHANFKISRCGFFISVDEPHLGASPDSLVSCTCHGSGVVEVKCPYCARDMALKWCSWQQRRPFLPWAISGWKPSLEVNTFLLLCQLQLHVTKYSYCDFVVWTKQTIHIECRHRNDKLLENVYTMHQLQNFFSELYFAWATIKVVLSQQ